MAANSDLEERVRRLEKANEVLSRRLAVADERAGEFRQYREAKRRYAQTQLIVWACFALLIALPFVIGAIAG